MRQRRTHRTARTAAGRGRLGAGLALVVLVGLAGCGSSAGGSEGSSGPDTPASASGASDPSGGASEVLIAPARIGVAELDMTIGDLEATGTVLETEDEAPECTGGQTTQLVRFSAAKEAKDEVGLARIFEGKVIDLSTDSEAARTAEGIGPGSTLTDVNAAYGDTARLVFDETRLEDFGFVSIGVHFDDGDDPTFNLLMDPETKEIFEVSMPYLLLCH